MRRAAKRADWSLGFHVQISASPGVARSSATSKPAICTNQRLGAGPGSSSKDGFGRPVPSHNRCVQKPMTPPTCLARSASFQSGQVGTWASTSPRIRARAKAAVSRSTAATCSAYSTPSVLAEDDRLDLGVGLEALGAELAADPRRLEAAERALEVEDHA